MDQGGQAARHVRQPDAGWEFRRGVLADRFHGLLLKAAESSAGRTGNNDRCDLERNSYIIMQPLPSSISAFCFCSAVRTA